MPETQQCPNCATPNEVGRALCQNCQMPLTSYAGELRGETYQGKLAAKIAAVENRPPAVAAMAVFEILFALFWPLRSVFTAFAARTVTNEEGTNYIASALGSIGPVLTAIVCVPIALCLLGLAACTWTQRTWAWMAGIGALVLFVLFNIKNAGHPTTILLLIAAAVLAFFWFQPKTKAWFGLD